MDLGMVAVFLELAITIQQFLLQAVAFAQRLAQNRSGQPADRLVQRIQEQQAEFCEQPLEQGLKRGAERGARSVSLPHHSNHIVAVRKIRERLAELVERRIGNWNATYRTLGNSNTAYGQRDRAMVGVEHEIVAHLGEIVILGSEPKNRDGGNALPG